MGTLRQFSQLRRRLRFRPSPSRPFRPVIAFRHSTDSSPFYPMLASLFLDAHSPRIPRWPARPVLSQSCPFSSRAASQEIEHGKPNQVAESVPEPELLDSGSLAGGSEVVSCGSSFVGDDYFLPVRAVVWMLDGLHELSGLSWWIVIVSSTLTLRIVLFPVLVLQLRKLKRISELLPKLPPPLPPPLSGRTYMEQISLFQRERQAVGCPSYLWFLAYFSIKAPCFILWMMSIRKMSLDHHPGFDDGGGLWFQNLTEVPHGILSFVFPSLVAGLHYTYVQLSFRKRLYGQEKGFFAGLAKHYKIYLDLLSVPIFLVAFYVPQACLIYWTTNGTLTVIQELCLKNTIMRKKLGLLDARNLTDMENLKQIVSVGKNSTDPLASHKKIPVQCLSPKELLALSVKLLANGHKDRPVHLLQLALEKDPEYVRALIVMGQTLLQKGLLVDANGYLERAVSKLYQLSHPMGVENVDLLIQASQWAGVVCIRQGKTAEGITHLQRVADMKEPEDLTGKVHYFDGLLLFASALYNDGRKAEAANVLRKVVSYNPAYREFLEQCESGRGD